MMTILAQLETIPVNPAPLSESARQILEEGAASSQNAADTFTPLWINVLQGGLFQAVADVGVVVAVAALGLFLVQFAKALKDGGEGKALEELIWPIIVISFLNNDGALLATANLELRAIGNEINDSLLSSAVADESLQQQFQQNRVESAIDQALEVSIQECIENRPQRQRPACIATAREEANDLRIQYGLDSGDIGFFGSALQYLLRSLLLSSHYAFSWIIELVLLILALLSPIAMGLSLLPTPAKPLIAWLGGFGGLFLTKLTFNLISGLAAYAFSASGAISTSLVLPVLLGLFAPVLATLIGLQGGNALLSALSSATIYTGFRAGSLLLRKGVFHPAGRAIRMASRSFFR